MINVTNINAGWLNLHIADKVFSVSYLTDVKDELDKIYMLDDKPLQLLYFDGEGSDLYLITRKEFNNIIVIWEECTKYGEFIVKRFEFDYETFKKELSEVWKRVEQDYYKHFDLNSFLEND